MGRNRNHLDYVKIEGLQTQSMNLVPRLKKRSPVDPKGVSPNQSSGGTPNVN
jgi:hypothetical protein